MEEFKLTSTKNPSDLSVRYTMTVPADAILYAGDCALVREIVRQFATRYVAEHYQEIAAKIDQKAIATLAVAEGAASISKTLQEKIPDKVLEVVRTEREVYQKGVFGGLKRI